MSQNDQLLNANTVSFSGLISGDNVYQVPLFQRDYSWEEEHWDDLWLDISNAKKDETKHYMGALVLMKKESKNFEIIDGQQRLTTLSILALSCIRIINDLIKNDIDADNNKERKDILLKKFIGFKSAASLMFTNKLILNNENNPIFASYLIQFHEINNIRRLSKSNKNLIGAYDFFYDKLRKEIYVQNSTTELIEYLEFIGDNLTFIEISVVDELNAYLVFETLNDRGLDLSVTDLLKNYLFSKVCDKDHQHLKNKWDNILKYVKYKDFSYFLRYFWISRNRLVTEKELFKRIKRTIADADGVFDLIGNLELNAELFAALYNPDDDLWKGEKEIKKALSELQLFNIRQSFPLLLACYTQLNTNDFARVCKMCSVISFRYSVIGGLKTNILELVYNDAAVKVSKGEITNPTGVFEALKKIYTSDEAFHNAFMAISISTKRKTKLVRYILYSIENQMANTTYNYIDDEGSIEHILPENPDEYWDNIFMKDIQIEFIYRIGNYTLLEPKKNNDCGTKPIDEKKEIYITSNYQLSNQFDYDQWTPQKVKHRQAYLAKQAKSIWKI